MNHSAKQKILCVSVMESWGGGELFLLDLATRIKEFDFTIASPEGNAFNKFISAKLRVIKINQLRKIYHVSDSWSLNAKLKIFFNIIFCSLKLFLVILKSKPNLILANGNFAALYSFIAVKLARKKMIVVQHLLYDIDSINAKVVAFVARKANKLVCVSNAAARRIEEIVGESKKDLISVIHKGICLPENEITERNDEKINIGFVGSIIRVKGIDNILKAVAPVLKENKNAFMHIYGSKINDDDSHNYFNELQLLIKQKKIENQVIFHGQVDSKIDIYNSIDVLINFSILEESLGYNILEAMSYSKVVIGTNSGGIPEVIEDKKNGFLVEQNNVNQLTKVINYCISNFKGKELHSIKNNARETIKYKFSMERFTVNYKNLLNSVLGAK